MDLFVRISADTPQELTRRDGLEKLKPFCRLPGSIMRLSVILIRGVASIYLSPVCLPIYEGV